MIWEKPRCIGEIPTERSGHTFTSAKCFAYMFGGCATAEVGKLALPGPTNDLYKLDMSSDSEYYWAKLKPKERGDEPCARWQHSATKIDDTKIIVFGGFTSSKEKVRLNDTWILDTTKDSWCAEKDFLVSDVAQESQWKVNAKVVERPCPRGSHSAALVNDAIFIFGGYGGDGYSRKDFNDLHALCTKSWQWFKLEAKGDAPKPRSGHKSVYFDGNLYVMGGWNAAETFDDVHILDTRTMVWRQADSACGPESWGDRRWNFTAVAAYAVPHWKIFIFGGNSGDLDQSRPQGHYRNDLQVLESIRTDGQGESSLEWSRPPVRGDKPCPRSDTEMFYSLNTGKLTLFGGWSHRWHGEVYCCDVGSVVGPSYNIFCISSKEWNEPIGPVTGESKMILVGKGFSSVTGVATVRFASTKGFIDVTGEILNDEQVSFSTPNFQKYGAVKAQVRLKIGSQSFTNNCVPFTFFSVTCSAETVAFGPGILDVNAVNQSAYFIIQAKDKHANDRVCGMDQFDVRIDLVSGESNISKIKIEHQLVDNHDGTYEVNYTPLVEGTYNINVKFNGTFNGLAGSIRGSSYKARAIVDNEAEDASLTGKATQNHVYGTIDRLKTFVAAAEKGIAKKVAKEDLKALISVKEHVRKIMNQTTTHENSIAATRAHLLYLKRKKVKFPQLDKTLKQLETCAKNWNNLKTMVPIATDRISSVDLIWTDKMKFKIEAYSRELEGKQNAFRKKQFWSYFDHEENRLSKAALEESLCSSYTELDSESRLLDENSYLCEIFDLNDLVVPCQNVVEEMKFGIARMEELWKISEGLDNHISGIEKEKWSELNVESLEDGAKAQLKAVKSSHKCVRWSPAFQAIDKNCKNFLITIPLVSLLMAKAMRSRHWETLMKVTKKPDFCPPTVNNDMVLCDLLALNLHKISNDVEEICDQAVKEEKIEETLVQLEGRWSKIVFTMTPYKKQDSEEEIPLLGIGEEDYESLENDQLVIQGILASRFVAQFKNEVSEWQKSLFTVNEVFLLIGEIQRTWSYLEPLFIHSEEVKRELPEDTTRFSSIDQNVQTTLKNAWAIQNVKEAFNEDGLSTSLDFVLEQLDLCKKSLADFLDGRRRQFPRYYFVSEADLLDILSNGGHPAKILSHIPKVYLSTKTIIFSKDGTSEEGRPVATEFVAGVGSEVCAFEPPVPLNGKVEIYMQTLLDAQKTSIFQTVKRSLVRYQQLPRKEWVLAKDTVSGRPLDPAQTTLLVLAINYVNEVETCFDGIANGDRDAMVAYSQKQKKQLSDLIQLTQSDLSKGDRTRVMVCITMDAHSRDIVEKMIRTKVDSINSFMWQSQLKHKYRAPLSHARYQDRDPELRGSNKERAEIAICDAILPYDYEYLGNGPRLVITPLTDRVYVTATQALNLNMGCAPAGPAGTGKTETTKDLANALAKLIYVINCK
jgi:dynein heavy chain